MGLVYEPVDDVIYAKPDESKVTMGGIQLPDREGPMEYFNGMGTVVAAGPGKVFISEKTGMVSRVPMPCKAGDRILFWIHGKNFFRPHKDEICMIRSEQVISIVKGEAEFN